MIPFLISDFEKSALSNLVKECFGSDFPDIFDKRQIDYVYRYLSELDAKSVLLEAAYVDRDYLDDYSKFYARQFNNLGHKCARLHFFAREIKHETIERAVLGEASDTENFELGNAYLGFMVVRPLPRTFIGRTCLKLYPSLLATNSQRKLLSRTYRSSLFGIELSVQSLAFQEQDKVVAACATTAIWSSLHAMAMQSTDAIPSLSQITKNAINFIDQSSNSFPNKELTSKQMLRALDVQGLRHYVREVSGISASRLFRTIRTYIDSGFPVILRGEVGVVAQPPQEHQSEKRPTIKMLAGHAVTVLGYKNDPPSGEMVLYVHDDRFGPFAHAKLGNMKNYQEDKTGTEEGTTSNDSVLLEFQEREKGKWSLVHEVIRPTAVFVATPRNVRVPLEAIEKLCGSIAKVFAVFAKNGADTKEQLTPDFRARLRSINDIKSSFRKSNELTAFDVSGDLSRFDSEAFIAGRLRFLTQNFARYQWWIEVIVSSRLVFTLTLDATDVPEGDAVTAVLFPKDSLAILRKVQELALAPNVAGEDNADSALFNSFLRRLRPVSSGFIDHLNRTFGELRAPRYIKAQEIEQSRLTANPSRMVFYDRSNKSLSSLFANRGENILIWVIDHEGGLIIGIEKKNSDIGHPGLTGSKPARIAGELKYDNGAACWIINAESGRYSRDYRNRETLLENARERFEAFFGGAGDAFKAEITKTTQP